MTAHQIVIVMLGIPENEDPFTTFRRDGITTHLTHLPYPYSLIGYPAQDIFTVQWVVSPQIKLFAKYIGFDDCTNIQYT